MWSWHHQCINLIMDALGALGASRLIGFRACGLNPSLNPGYARCGPGTTTRARRATEEAWLAHVVMMSSA